jgi:large subunit ribosomal protein L11
VSDLLKKAAGLDKGSNAPNRTKVGKISRSQLRDIAQTKMQDLNAVDLEGALQQIEGSARSMGITIEE